MPAVSSRGIAQCEDARRTVSNHVIFRGAGIEDDALRMRRCVQLGMAIEFFGFYFVKFGMHSVDWTSFLSVSEQATANSNFLMLLHIGAVWWYQSFTRDHLLARHVTRISLSRPVPDAGAGAGEPLAEPLAVFVETGPWMRRLEFWPGPGGDAVVPFEYVARFGGLHIDEGRGEVLDRGALDLLMSRQMHMASEKVFVDEEAKRRAFVGGYEVPDLLQEDPERAYDRLAALPAFLQRPLQWRGSSAMRNFGAAALAMGIGSVVILLPAGTVPLPSFVHGLVAPKPASFRY